MNAREIAYYYLNKGWKSREELQSILASYGFDLSSESCRDFRKDYEREYSCAKTTMVNNGKVLWDDYEYSKFAITKYKAPIFMALRLRLLMFFNFFK